MTIGRQGSNTVTIADKDYLLAGGDKTHLVPEAQEATSGRPALPLWRFESVEMWHEFYDLDQLQEPRKMATKRAFVDGERTTPDR